MEGNRAPQAPVSRIKSTQFPRIGIKHGLIRQTHQKAARVRRTRSRRNALTMRRPRNSMNRASTPPGKWRCAGTFDAQSACGIQFDQCVWHRITSFAPGSTAATASWETARASRTDRDPSETTRNSPPTHHQKRQRIVEGETGGLLHSREGCAHSLNDSLPSRHERERREKIEVFDQPLAALADLRARHRLSRQIEVQHASHVHTVRRQTAGTYSQCADSRRAPCTCRRAGRAGIRCREFRDSRWPA